MKIIFFSRKKNFCKLFKKYEKKIQEITNISFNKKDSIIEVNIVDKKTMYDLTGKYFGLNYHTDVIAFNYKNCFKSKDLLEGEIIISESEIYKQSKYYNEKIVETFLLFILHGILHIKGFNDLEDKDKKKMQKYQLKYLSIILNK